jgi:biotin carboxyl carrier protein
VGSATATKEGSGFVSTFVNAPMAGKILRLEAEAGERVEEDDVLLIMEALKMEIPVVAPVSGLVKSIRVSTGQAVEADEPLAEIE